jgi:hypothetical protein
MRTRTLLRPHEGLSDPPRRTVGESRPRADRGRADSGGQGDEAARGWRRILELARPVVAFVAAVLLILVLLLAVGLLLTPDPSVEPLPMPEPIVQTLAG